MTISILHKDDFNVDKTGKIYFTYSDLLKLPEWPNSPQIELFNGELFISPSPTIYHQVVSDNLLYQIKHFLNANPIGKVYSAPVDVVFSEKYVIIPDLTFILKSNLEIVKGKNIEGTPDLLIEILSSNRENDEIRKYQLYEQNKVKEYWIVYPDEKLIKLYLFDENSGNYTEGNIFTIDDEITSSILQGFKIPVKLVFET
ncbi:MAG: Uma2 family endonuclease [Candidatus Heimdallarchaeota archaeon]|nr:Uma2 family endonuclease [Candidatus Heimdallarchaeota archaeon]